MKYNLQKSNQNNGGGRTFVFECSYFDENENMNSSKKFTKEFMSYEMERPSSSGFFETRNFDLALNV
jgi:hypothetical protein